MAGEFPSGKSATKSAGKDFKTKNLFLCSCPFAVSTLFTRDLGFYSSGLCHARYCLVILATGQYEAAHFVRRVLRTPELNTQAKRMGAVIRVTHTGFAVWRINAQEESRFEWPDTA